MSTKPSVNKNSFWILAPLFGTLLYIVCYVVAALLYPGGSQADKNAVGFSWVNNYWCNLLNENAMNGLHNPGRPVALAGMFVLCLTLAVFWSVFPRFVHFTNNSRLAVQLSGTIAMALALFLFTDLHDIIIDVASLFGLVATAGTFAGLYKVRWYRLIWFGAFNILLVGLNNYLYYTKGMMVYLPVIQKITFASFLVWICGIALCMYGSNQLTSPPIK